MGKFICEHWTAVALSFIISAVFFIIFFGVRAELRVCDEFKIKYAEGECVWRSYVGCLWVMPDGTARHK